MFPTPTPTKKKRRKKDPKIFHSGKYTSRNSDSNCNLYQNNTQPYYDVRKKKTHSLRTKGMTAQTTVNNGILAQPGQVDKLCSRMEKPTETFF